MSKAKPKQGRQPSNGNRWCSIATTLWSGRCRTAAGGSPQLLDRAALLLSNGQRILLLAQSRITLGRERLDNCGQRSNDIVLRPGPAPRMQKRTRPDHSGVHLAISLTADGLEIEDQSSCGTYAGGEKFAKLLVTPDNFAAR